MARELMRLVFLLSVELIAIVLLTVGILKFYPRPTSFVIAGSLLFAIAQGFVPKVYQGPTVVDLASDYFSEEVDEEGEEMEALRELQESVDVPDKSSHQIRDIKPTLLYQTQDKDPQIESIREEHPGI